MPGRNPQPQQSRPGTANGRAKLRDVDVALMRALAQHGVKQTMLCAMFDASPARVSLIVRGQAWRHV